MRQRARGAHCAPLSPSADERLRSLGLNERQKRAVAYVREHGKITNREYQRMEGISERTATRDFTALVQQGPLVPFPKITVEEQRRVTAYLDAVQAEVDEMRGLQAQDAELLDQLEQSILEHAFRGELAELVGCAPRTK